MRLTYIIVLLLITMVIVSSKHDKKKKKKKHRSTSSDSDLDISDDSLTFSDLDDDDESKHKRESRDYDGSLFDMRGELMKRFFFYSGSMQKNLVCSPLTALLPLGKLAYGAKDDTLKELLAAIGVSSIDKVESRFKKYLHEMRHLSGVTLAVSRIYLNKEKKLRWSFMDKTNDVFKYSAESLNMNDPPGAAAKINGWVRSETHGAIKNILGPSDLSSRTNLVVVNAAYFKGRWKYPFPKVRADTFYSSSRESPVSMMKITERFDIGSSTALDAKIIKIPYKNERAHLIVILPNSRAGLPILFTQLRLAPSLLKNIKLKKKTVKLSLPMFKIESEINLAQKYMLFGVRGIFNDQTGLQKMLDHGTVKVDVAKQKVIFEMTTEGAVQGGPAPTEGGGWRPAPTWPTPPKWGKNPTWGPPPTYTYGKPPPTWPHSVLRRKSHKRSGDENFEANHPFMFFVVMNGQQLFAGVFIGF